MLSIAHVYLHKLSIALILLLTVGLGSDLLAAEMNPLPELGNTETMDRTLSEEITDDYIFPRPNNQQQLPTKITDSKPVIDLKETSKTTNDTKIDQKPTKKTKLQAPIENVVDLDQAQVDQKTNDQTVTQAWLPLLTESVNPSDTVWQHIRKSNRLPMIDNDRVNFYTEQYLRESLWISKILYRGSPYLSHLVSTLDRRFLPVELALLPAIESGYLPTAKSSGSAVGLWQIVPITAREIGIKRDVWFDGRGDVLASTTAAIDYLSYLNAEFNGDWALTLAAYNAGPGRVRAAMKKNAQADLPTDYWSLDLPRETQNYVPKLLALVGLIKKTDHGGFDMPDVRMEPAFESIDVGFRVSIDKAAKLAGIDKDLLHSLNAGLIHGVTAPDGPHYLLIPAGTGGQFQQAFANVDRDTVFSEPKTHDVTDGDTISSIALKYDISQRRLLAMNGLDDTKIRIGQKLAVLDARNVPQSVVEYVVSIGDTLSEIADTFSVNMDDIKLSNGDSPDGDVIHPGDTLNIIVTSPTSG